MKVGDKVAIKDDADVVIEDCYVRHGIIISKSLASDSKYAWFTVKFADSIVENYMSYELDTISDKEYFQRQLKG